LLELGLRGSERFRVEEAPGRLRVAKFSRMKYLQDRGPTSGGSGWQNLLDGLNDVEISEGVLGCLNTSHHPDEGQFLITTSTYSKTHISSIPFHPKSIQMIRHIGI